VFVHTVFSGRGERTVPHARRADSRPTPGPSDADSSQVSGAVHNATCNLCDSRIEGERYKCVICPDFDVCSSCFSITQEQHPTHGFVKVNKPDDLMMRQGLASRQVNHLATCDSCHRSISGIRYKCMHPDCPDYDLCDNCECLPIPVHPPIHPMLKMKTPDTVVPTVYRVGQTDLILTTDGTYVSAPASPVPTVVRLNSHITKPPTVVTFPQQLPESPNQSMAEEDNRDVCLPGYYQASAVPSPEIPFVPALPAQDSRSDYEVGLHDVAKRDVTEHHVPVEVSSWTLWDPRLNQSHGNSRSPSPDMPALFVPRRLPPPAPVLNAGFPLTPLALDNTHDVYRELWPLVNQEVKSSFENEAGRQQSYGASSSKVEDSGPSGFTPSLSGRDSLPVAESPITHESLLATPAAPPPEMLQRESRATFSLNRSLAALLNGYRTPSPTPSDDGQRGMIPVPAPRNLPGSFVNDDVNVDEQPDNLFSLTQVKAEGVKLESPHSVPTLLELLRDDTQCATSPRTSETPVDRDSAAQLNSAFLWDTTVPDGQVFPPGAEFIKAWRMMNDGGRAWPEETELVFVAGEPLIQQGLTGRDQGLRTKVGCVDPGEELDVWTSELKVPDAPGRYVSYWKLYDGHEYFGSSVWIDVTVADSDTSSEDASLASSSVVMPGRADVVSHTTSLQSALGADQISVSVSATISESKPTDDDAVSIGSSVSLISVPTTAESDVEEVQSVGAQQSRVELRNDEAAEDVEYVLLYDSRSEDD